MFCVLFRQSKKPRTLKTSTDVRKHSKKNVLQPPGDIQYASQNAEEVSSDVFCDVSGSIPT